MNRMIYKEVPPNHMKWWTQKEDEKLWETFFKTRFVFHNTRHNKDEVRYWSPKQLGEMFGRSAGAMLNRLKDIRAIEMSGNGFYVTGTDVRYADLGYWPTHHRGGRIYPRYRG